MLEEMIGKLMEENGLTAPGHVRVHPLADPETEGLLPTLGDVRQIGMVKGVRIHADASIPAGEIRFIDSNGRITKISTGYDEPKPKPKKRPKRRKGKSPRKNLTFQPATS